LKSYFLKKIIQDPLLIDLATSLFDDTEETLLFFLNKFDLPASPSLLDPIDKQIHDSGKLQSFHKTQVSQLLFYLENLLSPLKEKNIFAEGSKATIDQNNASHSPPLTDTYLSSFDGQESTQEEHEEDYGSDYDSMIASSEEDKEKEEERDEELFIHTLQAPSKKRTLADIETGVVSEDRKSIKKGKLHQETFERKNKNRPGQTARRKYAANNFVYYFDFMDVFRQYEGLYGEKANHVIKQRKIDNSQRRTSANPSISKGSQARLNPTKEDALHPSWQAKKLQAEKLAHLDFKGKHEVFDD
jgi:BUD22